MKYPDILFKNGSKARIALDSFIAAGTISLAACLAATIAAICVIETIV